MRLAFTDRRDGIAAANILRRCQHRVGKTVAVLHVFRDEMGDDFSVGFRFKAVPLLLELLLERQIVLDDAVVDEHAPAGAMRMGVLLGWFAMGRPSRMADPGGPTEALFRQRLFQIDQLADTAADFDFSVMVNRDAGRIVSAIFQALQAIQQNGNRVLITDVSDYPAHGAYPFFVRGVLPALRSTESWGDRRGALVVLFDGMDAARFRDPLDGVVAGRSPEVPCAPPSSRSARRFVAHPTRLVWIVLEIASESGGTSCVIVVPAAITDPLPIVTGATSCVSLPMKTSSSMTVSYL